MHFEPWHLAVGRERTTCFWDGWLETADLCHPLQSVTAVMSPFLAQRRSLWEFVGDTNSEG